MKMPVIKLLKISAVREGRVYIPKQVRQILGLELNDTILWYVNERGEVCVKKAVEKRISDLF